MEHGGRAGARVTRRRVAWVVVAGALVVVGAVAVALASGDEPEEGPQSRRQPPTTVARPALEGGKLVRYGKVEVEVPGDLRVYPDGSWICENYDERAVYLGQSSDKSAECDPGSASALTIGLTPLDPNSDLTGPPTTLGSVRGLVVTDEEDRIGVALTSVDTFVSLTFPPGQREEADAVLATVRIVDGD